MLVYNAQRTLEPTTFSVPVIQARYNHTWSIEDSYLPVDLAHCERRTNYLHSMGSK